MVTFHKNIGEIMPGMKFVKKDGHNTILVVTERTTDDEERFNLYSIDHGYSYYTVDMPKECLERNIREFVNELYLFPLTDGEIRITV